MCKQQSKQQTIMMHSSACRIRQHDAFVSITHSSAWRTRQHDALISMTHSSEWRTRQLDALVSMTNVFHLINILSAKAIWTLECNNFTTIMLHKSYRVSNNYPQYITSICDPLRPKRLMWMLSVSLLAGNILLDLVCMWSYTTWARIISWMKMRLQWLMMHLLLFQI